MTLYTSQDTNGSVTIRLSQRAVRGSGGVGILVKDSMFVDKQYKNILWASFTNINNLENFMYMFATSHQLPLVGGKSHFLIKSYTTKMVGTGSSVGISKLG